MRLLLYLVSTLALLEPSAIAQTVTLDLSADGRRQVIDGFGAHQGDADTRAGWWQALYYDDLGASMYRVDLTPRFVAPYSDLNYYSPWFMGSGTDSVFNLEDPDNPDGPEGNRVRTYTGPDDYSRLFGGERAPIAVMGPDIEANLAYFTYPDDGAIPAGLARRDALGDFKLIGSIWSPAPWVKISSGNTYPQNWWPGPVQGTPWPFVWGGNFAGGRLDVSGVPLDVFDDAALGGTGPTSALTQFARSTAAYLLGYQRAYDTAFYAISIQNELNFEQFYNSATYPLAGQYLAAVKAVRAEFDRHEELREIRIMGPEDLLGGDAYGLWQYGGAADPTHKNLQYLRALAADPEAADAVDFFAIHGYANDGVSAAGASPTAWTWWTDGWSASPAPGIPANVDGFTAYGKKSWMTETSGEEDAWLAPATGFPNNGGWSIALKIHQALTTGRQSAWLYWTFTEEEDGRASREALTTQARGANGPKYVAAKHFFRYIRPAAVRVATSVTGADDLAASAYMHDADRTLTVVLVNASPDARTVTLRLPGEANRELAFSTYTSSAGALWQTGEAQAQDGSAEVTVPGYGVATLHGTDFTPTPAEPERRQPETFRLFQNYPNPFNPTTRIPYRLAEPGHVRLTVYDPTGRMVARLVDEVRPAGDHGALFEARGLPGGVYLYRVQVGARTARRTMVLLP